MGNPSKSPFMQKPGSSGMSRKETSFSCLDLDHDVTRSTTSITREQYQAVVNSCDRFRVQLPDKDQPQFELHYPPTQEHPYFQIGGQVYKQPLAYTEARRQMLAKNPWWPYWYPSQSSSRPDPPSAIINLDPQGTPVFKAGNSSQPNTATAEDEVTDGNIRKRKHDSLRSEDGWSDSDADTEMEMDGDDGDDGCRNDDSKQEMTEDGKRRKLG
ncbi:uncharacterized protein AB675_5474 [Cyphellophora attinorum]|uniref:Uncharacterized protein n=1 Tax=Cyphellophora attinorum TaxID=1664694 RepID=A0A0N1H708_9EURO|nr:uncharacterized protein AB675_5474 [Phialophora attinorum]KPI42042.1 hypothetical protein AB675_5474 [Phialophora attinorum]